MSSETLIEHDPTSADSKSRHQTIGDPSNRLRYATKIMVGDTQYSSNDFGQNDDGKP